MIYRWKHRVAERFGEIVTTIKAFETKLLFEILTDSVSRILFLEE